MRLLIATLTIGGLGTAIVWAFLRGLHAMRQQECVLHFPHDGEFLRDHLRRSNWHVEARRGHDFTGPIE